MLKFGSVLFGYSDGSFIVPHFQVKEPYCSCLAVAMISSLRVIVHHAKMIVCMGSWCNFCGGFSSRYLLNQCLQETKVIN